MTLPERKKASEFMAQGIPLNQLIGTSKPKVKPRVSYAEVREAAKRRK